MRVLRRMERNEYLALLSLCDVSLDTPHYGGGANTVYDASAVGVPLVTLPGEFHRSRWAAAVNAGACMSRVPLASSDGANISRVLALDAKQQPSKKAANAAVLRPSRGW